MRIRFVLLLILLISLNSVSAQETAEYEVITPDNIGDLQMTVVGRGYLADFAWSQDSSTIAVASSGGLWLYNPLNLNETPVRQDTRPLDTVAYSDDGRYLAVGGTTSASQVGCEIFGIDTLTVWNLSTGEIQLQVDTSAVNIMFFPNRNLLLTVNRESGLELWDIDTGERLVYSRYLVPSGASHTFGTDIILSISPEGDYFSAVSFYYRDDEPYVWSTQNVIDSGQISLETVELSVSASDDWLTQSNFSPNGELQAGSTPNQLTVWDNELEEVSSLYAHNGSLQSLAFHPNGTEIANYHFSGQIRLVDTETLQPTHILQPDENSGSRLLYSPNGQLLASGTSNFDRKIYLWDTLTGERLATYEIENGHYSVFPTLFTSDNRYLFVTSPGERSSPSNLVIIDLENGEIITDLMTDGILGDISISPDGLTLAVDLRNRDASGDTSRLQIWNLSEIDTESRVQVSWEFNTALGSIDFVNNNLLAYEREVDYCSITVSLFDVQTGTETELHTVDGNQLDANLLYAPSLNPERTLLVVPTQTGIRFWNLNTRRELTSIDTRRTVYVSFSEDGRSLLSVHGATLGDEIRLWRVPAQGE